MFKKILAGILSAVIVFSSLTPAVIATESVAISQEETTDQEVVEEEITEEEKEEDKVESEIEESVEEIEIQEEQIVETTIIEEVVEEEQTTQKMNTAALIDESERTVIEEGTCGDNLTWVLYDDGELVISGEGTMDIGASSYSDYPWWGCDRSKIKKLTIDENIISIGDHAFASYTNYYTNLEEVILPKTIITIGDYAFDGCVLKNIQLPENVNSIGEYAFANCDGLTEVKLPSKLTVISEGAFDDCDNLKRISIPSSIKVIGEDVLDSCSNLEEVIYEGTWKEWKAVMLSSDGDPQIDDSIVKTEYSFTYSSNEDSTITITGVDEGGIGGKVQIPETIDGHRVTAIGEKAFSNNSDIRVLDIPASIKVIKKQAFYDAELKELTLHEGLESVEDYAFYSALGHHWSSSEPYYIEIEELILPEGLQTIGKYAFSNTYMNDGEIQVPDSIKIIGEAAFDSSDKIFFKGSAQQWIDIHNTDTSKYPPTDYVTFQGDGCGFIKRINDDKSVSYELLFWSDASGDVIVPSEFRDIPVTAIKSLAFKGNKNVKSVVIPESVNIINYQIFSGCSNLESVEVNAPIYSLPDSMFYDCVSLTTVSLPHTLTSIGTNAFNQCISLEDVYYDSSYNWENMEFESGNSALDDAELHFVHDWGYEITTYDYVERIYITGKSNATEILEIPGDFHGIPVKGIGDRYWHDDNPPGIFQDNKTIKKVIIPDSVETIYYNAFRGCSNLAEINFSENLTGIGPYAFAGCTSLKSIYIPKELELSHHAFEGCTGLETIAFASEYDNGFYCHLFAGCTNVKEITMPNENFSLWGGCENCDMNSATWEDRAASVFEGVPRNAKVKVAKNSNPYRRMVELGFTNLSVAIVLQNITLPSTVSVEQGKTKTVAVTKVPTNANDSLNLVWTSSDESIATVDANGVITGKKIGTTQITVKDLNSGKTAKTTVSVTVPAASVFSVNLHPGVDPLGLQKGQSVTMMITATLVDQLEPEMFTFISSDDSVATVDENGVITAVSDGKSAVSVKITAKLNNDPYDRKFSVSVKTIPVQTEEIQIYAPNEELSDNQLILSKSKVADGDYEIQLRANPLDCNGVGTSVPLTWKSSNTKVATVAADGTVLVKKNADGVATITVTAKDQKMTSQSVLIDVRDYSPRLSVSTVTLNTNTDEEAQIEAYLTYGVELLNVRLEGDNRFYINRRSGEYGTVFNIGATEVVPNGTYKLKLVTESEGIGEVVQNFTIKVANKVPSVAVKQINAFNLFYTDSTADVSVTAKDIAVKNVMLEDTESFQGIFDEETGILNVSYGDENAALDKKATLVIELEGYREPVTKAFNVNAKETKPTLTPSRKNTKLSALTTEGIPLQIINKQTNEPINWENCSVDILETSIAYVEYTYEETDLILSPILNDAYKFVNNKTSHVAKLEVQQDNWKKPLTVSHSIAVNAAIPTIKAQSATLTLNSLFGNSATTILIPSVLNCPEPIEYIPEAVIENENTEKLDIEVEGWNLTARFKDIEDVPANGSYKYKVKAIIPGFDAEETIVIPVTIKVASTIPKVTLGKTSISLNKTITDNMSVSVTAATGFEVTNAKIENAAGNLLTEEQLAVTFDETTKLLTAVVLDPGIPNGTYKYTVTPKVKMNGVDTDEVETKALTLSVKVYEGNPQVKTSAAGSIDLVTRGTGITYTVTGGTKFNYDVSKMVTDEISLTGLNADRFNLEVLGENKKGQPQILITAKEDAEFTTTEICKIQISFVMDGISERIQTTELKFKPKQSTLSVAVGGNTTIYTGVGAGKITLDVKKPVDAQIAAVEILDTKATTVPAGAIWFQADKENGRYVINYYIEDAGKLKVGASYKLALAITPDGNATNKVPQTVSVALKVQR